MTEDRNQGSDDRDQKGQLSDPCHLSSVISLSRRQFLQTLPVLAGMAAVGFPFSTPAFAAPAGARRLVVGTGHWAACVVDLSTGKSIQAPLPFLPHSFVQNPAKPDRIWAIERWDFKKPADVPGAFSAAEIDIGAGELVKQFAPAKGSAFFGHGFFKHGGDVLFISRVIWNRARGILPAMTPPR